MANATVKVERAEASFQPDFTFGRPSSHGHASPSSSNPHSSGSNSPFRFVGMDSLPQWPPASTASDPLQNAISFGDEDLDELGDLVDVDSHSGQRMSSSARQRAEREKIVRRRSSKACDQCRKSKCKCEPSGSGQPCKSCNVLGTACTFLGPSKKRGPPKGYIDAIEARLHQTEALLGILLSSDDARAMSLLQELSQDPLAKDIIDRVNSSPYGVKGRKKESHEGPPTKSRHNASDATTPLKVEERSELITTHPSNEWQDQVLKLISSSGAVKTSPRTRDRPVLSLQASRHSSPDQSDDTDGSPQTGRRLRRKVDNFQPPPIALTTTAANSLSPVGIYGSGSSGSGADSSSEEEDVAGAVGQLSLNEDEEVRYHGKASGLHLLGAKNRLDRRNEGGIWRFPKARVWPPLPPGSTEQPIHQLGVPSLPSIDIQQHLLDLYFTYVHPSFPVVHKHAFLEAFKTHCFSSNTGGTSPSSEPASATDSSAFSRRPKPIPALLLLTMFAISARYSDHPSIPPRPSNASIMWEAGDDFLNQAKLLLDRSYSSSRPSTCQALLLMGYREIGIGAMAQAWTYIGMAIRMAQDLGMHRKADDWAREELGGRIFGDWELNERRRIWYAAVVMDKYVSTYIGRPVAIFETDFDTLLPGEDDLEEMEEWKHPFASVPTVQQGPVPRRVISCFNASATLSAITSAVVQSIYAVRPMSSRHAELASLEGRLDRWLLDLPKHLQYEPGTKYPVPLPHVLVLHMQYWCTVLLLHRPFVRIDSQDAKNKRHDSPTEEAGSALRRSYELSSGAANHLTSIGKVYADNYPISCCPVFLCYYIFTASLMHVTSVCARPDDPQAQLGLSKCMELLEMMEIVWPSAGRALELLRGSNVLQNGSHVTEPPVLGLSMRHKRSAEHSLNDSQPRHSKPSTNYDYSYVPSQSMYPDSMIPVASPVAQGGVSQAPYWPDAMSFSNPLSTSAFPQVYSTGFVDDPRVYSSRQATGPPHRPAYPTYWSEYSIYPSLGNSFSNVPEQSTHLPRTSSSSYNPDHFH